MINSSLLPFFIDFKEFSLIYKPIRKQKSGNFGEICLMRNIKNNIIYQIKEETITSQHEITDLMYCLEKLLILNTHPNFMKFISFSLKKNHTLLQNRMENTSTTILMVYEYFKNDLEQEINTIQKQRQLFTEKQLCQFLQETVQALAFLKNVGRVFLDFSLNSIYLSENKTIKLAYTNYHSTNMEKIQKKEVVFYNCFLAPEQLAFLDSQKNNQFQHIDESKLDIFCLALLIVHLAAFENKDRFYNISLKQLNFEAIYKKISLMRSLYGSKFTDLVCQMLALDPNLRPSYVDIQQQIKNHLFLTNNKNFFTPPKQKSSSNSKKKITEISKDKSFDSAFFSLSFKNPAKSEEKFLNESKSTKRTEKTTISFPSKEISVGTNRNAIFQRLKQRKNEAKTPPRVSPVSNRHKFFSLQKQRSPLERSQEKSFCKKSKIDLSKITQNIRLLEKQIIIDPLTGILKANIVKKIYSDNSVYLGQIQNNKREGKGIYYFSHYEIYGGDWHDDKFHGSGVYLYDNGDRYEGQLACGAKQGKGVYYYFNGDKYDGQWEQNFKHGFGIFYYTNNERFEGYWHKNQKHGKGVYYFDKGDKFEGMWVKGKKNGKGTVYFFDKSIFEGIWIDNSPNGPGVLKYSNGDIYKGNFLSGLKEGEGIYQHEIGGNYSGDWKNDERNGKGIHCYSNGDKYIGLVYNGDRVGYGEYIYSTGEKYSGEWVDNLRQGKGKLILSGKSYYDGDWNNGKREGYGVMIYENGDKYEGYWLNDKKHGKGFYQWNNGTFYNGYWQNDNMNGEGVYLDESGLEISGVWMENELRD